MPDADDLRAYIDAPVSAGQAAAVIGVVRAMVSAYTRGVGFDNGDPNDELSAVILSASARLLATTSGAIQESIGPIQVRWADAFGFTLPELAVLNRYRRRAT